jgi:hypothetical protein
VTRRLALWVPLQGGADELSAAFQAEPDTWLPAPATSRGPGHWGVELHAGPVNRMVTCLVGPAVSDATGVSRRLAWTADAEPGTNERVLPSFDGHLALRQEPDHTELVLEGTYTAPTGRMGAALDANQLQRLAEAMGASMLEECAARLLGPV